MMYRKLVPKAYYKPVEIPKPVEVSTGTGRSLKPMDLTPRLWVRFPVDEACHKHPGPDLVLAAEPIKTCSMLCNTVYNM